MSIEKTEAPRVGPRIFGRDMSPIQSGWRCFFGHVECTITNPSYVLGNYRRPAWSIGGGYFYVESTAACEFAIERELTRISDAITAARDAAKERT